MHALADPEDVAAIFRPLTADERTLAVGLINQASVMLRLRARRCSIDIEALTADPLVGDAITAAVANAVKRVLMNPRALRQWSEGEGPLTESATIDAAVSSGALYLDKRDLVDIFPTRRRVHSFRVRAGLG